jgi:asparagine synthase (glutamine-hydrolysing)
MCGISGFAYKDPDRPVNKALLKQMTDIIRHRGPDGEGFHTDAGAALGMRRLSIIDLKTGDQPIYNEDRSIAIVCNGEIYNHQSLRKTLRQKGHKFTTQSDVEVIVHLYEEFGERCVEHLRGMFAFAIWDNNKKQLFLARDRLGIKPLHYSVADDGTLYFASELKSLLITNEINRDINPQSFTDLFTFGYVLTPRTLFKEINHVAPGHYLLFQKGKLSYQKYWDLSFSKKQDLKEEEWIDALREKLDETIRIHLNSDVPVSGWLSAGIDSSSIIAIANRLTDTPIQTYSLGFKDRAYDELTTQKTLEQYQGFETPNQRIIVQSDHFDLFRKAIWHCETPSTSGVDMVRLLLAEETSKKNKIALTGEGADEIFCGYPWYRFEKICRPFSIIPRPIRELLILGSIGKRWKPWSSNVFLAPRKMNLLRYVDLVSPFEPGIAENLFSSDLLENTDRHDKAYLTLTDFPGFSNWDALEQIQYMETKSRMTDFIIHGLDRISMAHSVEARVPFLDHELVEMASQMPSSIKMRRLKEKYILRKAMHGRLPDEITERKKRGLAAPSNIWLRGKLPEFAEDMFSEDNIRKKGYFKPEYVRSLLDDHQKNNNHGRALMAVLGIQVWDDLFRNGCLSTEDI